MERFHSCPPSSPPLFFIIPAFFLPPHLPLISLPLSSSLFLISIIRATFLGAQGTFCPELSCGSPGALSFPPTFLCFSASRRDYEGLTQGGQSPGAHGTLSLCWFRGHAQWCCWLYVLAPSSGLTPGEVQEIINGAEDQTMCKASSQSLCSSSDPWSVFKLKQCVQEKGVMHLKQSWLRDWPGGRRPLLAACQACDRYLSCSLKPPAASAPLSPPMPLHRFPFGTVAVTLRATGLLPP